MGHAPFDTGVDLTDDLRLGQGTASLEYKEEVRPQPFTKTWMEWVAENREQIWRQNSSAGGDFILFTVPRGHILYITSAYLSIADDSGNIGSGSAILALDKLDPATAILSVVFDTRVGSPPFVNVVSLSFPMPLAVNEGRQVTSFKFNPELVVATGFHGWLEPKKI